MARPMTRERGPLGETILRLRIERDMTQEQLADAIGVQQSRIAEIESGAVRSPRLDTLVKVADALGVSAGDLVSSATAPRSRRRSGKRTA